MTRIKYTKLANGLITTDWITVGSNLVLRGVIDSRGLCITIYNTERAILTESVPNTRVGKTRIKQILISYGLKFDSEIRRTTPKSNT